MGLPISIIQRRKPIALALLLRYLINLITFDFYYLASTLSMIATITTTAIKVIFYSKLYYAILGLYLYLPFISLFKREVYLNLIIDLFFICEF